MSMIYRTAGSSSGGGGGSSGKILQVVSSEKNDYGSITGDTKTDTGLSCSITPSNTANKIFIIASLNVGCGPNHTAYFYALRDTTEIGLGTGGTDAVSFMVYPDQYISSGDSMVFAETVGWSFLDSPSSTSALTYKIQYRAIVAGQTVFLNRRGFDTQWATSSNLTVMEVDGT